jgi:putative endonuclease
MHEHKHGLIDGFSKKYNLHKLVHLEETNDVRLAIEREKELKKWKRQWKLDLIKVENPDLVDLSDLLG